jgi:hypothetical protein
MYKSFLLSFCLPFTQKNCARENYEFRLSLWQKVWNGELAYSCFLEVIKAFLFPETQLNKTPNVCPSKSKESFLRGL